MPRGKSQYKKGAKKIDPDSFDFGENASGENEDGVSAVDLVVGKIEREMAEAKAEAERRQRISVSNRETRLHGRMFEEMIERACAVYESEGLAVIKKIPEPRRVVGRTGGRSSMMICVNEKKADPDFQGSLAPDGKHIVFDAKHTDKDKVMKNALTDNQRDVLEAHLSCGAECFVCVSFGFEKFFLIPYSVWRDMKKVFGRQYILPDDEQIREYSVPFAVTGEKKGEPLLTVWFLGKPGDCPDGSETPEKTGTSVSFD